MLHNAEIVVHYENMNFYVPCMGIQADWYRPCYTNQRTAGQCPARRVLFSWHDLEIKISCLTRIMTGEWRLRIQNHTLSRAREDHAMLTSRDRRQQSSGSKCLLTSAWMESPRPCNQ